MSQQQLGADSDWEAERVKTILKPFDEMTDQDKNDLRARMDLVFPLVKGGE